MLGFVGLFSFETIVQVIAFGKIYLQTVNLIETITLLAAVGFNVWGIAVPTRATSNLPGIQRLLMVVVLICKM